MEEEPVQFPARRQGWIAAATKGLRKSLFTMLMAMVVLGSFLQIYDDYPDYWSKAPVPFHIFLLTQVALLCLLAFVTSTESF